MNSYKLNGIAGHLTRQAICKGLQIHHTEIYKVIKDIGRDGTIRTKDGRGFKLNLEQVFGIIQKDYLTEVERCKNDVVYFMEKYCMINGEPISLRDYAANFADTWCNSKLKENEKIIKIKNT